MAGSDSGKLRKIRLVTDGACIGNPGPGGWACILRYESHQKVQVGGEIETTNNRMELQAAIEGLKALRVSCAVTLISDSRYLLNGISTWRHAWRQAGWVRSRKKTEEPIPNADLWKILDELAERHVIVCEWVRGHSGHPDNERCDGLAMEEAEKQARNLVDDLPCWTRSKSNSTAH